MGKTFRQAAVDFLFAPFRFTGISESSRIFGNLKLTTLEQERIQALLPYIQGRLLDIGCGKNMLVKEYKRTGGEGIGVDVYDYGGDAMIIENSSNLAFPNGSFDTIVFAACLNHIPYRLDALREAHRVVNNQGQVIITMINPVIGFLVHKIWELRRQGLDFERGIGEGELYGLWGSEVVKLATATGFRLVRHGRFDYTLNHLYIFEKEISEQV